jgi:hypothetical protein
MGYVYESVKDSLIHNGFEDFNEYIAIIRQIGIYMSMDDETFDKEVPLDVDELEDIF